MVLLVLMTNQAAGLVALDCTRTGGTRLHTEQLCEKVCVSLAEEQMDSSTPAHARHCTM